VTLFYILATLAILQGVISLIAGIRAAGHIRRSRPQSAWRPRVVVFCPCKGTDAEFQKNIRSILDQEYPNLRVVFVVESVRDPAWDALKTLGATVLVAGEAAERGQKVHNLLYAVEYAAGDADVFAFCDADARFPKDWVSSLIAPLDDDAVAVATGYRWYVPKPGRLASLVRSMWNASVVTVLGAHTRNFAWGGSMALRRDVFDRIRVRDAWAGAVSDDYAVTHAARAARMQIVFVPACLVPSYGDCTWGEVLEFTTRQIVITRVYEPRMWRMAMLTGTTFNIAFWWAAFLAWSDPGAAAILGALYALAGIKSWTRRKAVATVLPESALSNYR